MQWLGPFCIMVLTWILTANSIRKVKTRPATYQRAFKRYLILRSSLISLLVWGAYYVFTFTSLKG